jgi:hypothetical protein
MLTVVNDKTHDRSDVRRHIKVPIRFQLELLYCALHPNLLCILSFTTVNVSYIQVELKKKYSEFKRSEVKII